MNTETTTGTPRRGTFKTLGIKIGDTFEWYGSLSYPVAPVGGPVRRVTGDNKRAVYIEDIATGKVSYIGSAAQMNWAVTR